VNIYFDYNRADLKAIEKSKLERIGPFLTEYSQLRVMIEGNCDERGSSEYNLGLGERRAQTVKRWLTSYGIDGSRLETTSYGKERPVRSGCEDEECHAANRRVEWRVIGR
jgi:peptidoglycan-associated lipoprotein